MYSLETYKIKIFHSIKKSNPEIFFEIFLIKRNDFFISLFY